MHIKHQQILNVAGATAARALSAAYGTEYKPTILFVREGEGSGEPAPNAGGDGKISLTSEELNAKIAEAVAAQVAGLQSKNNELLGTNKKLKEAAAAFEGLDLEKLKGYAERLDKDEDARLIADGKTSELIDKYTQRMRAEHQAQLAEREAQVAAERDRADKYKGAVLDSQILAVTAGLHKGAVEDALMVARNTFTLDAEGRAVKMGPNGQPELGKDGKTPFGPAEWMEMQKQAKPHWFPATTSGSGSSNAREASGTGKTITRAAFDALPGHEKAAVIGAGTKVID